MGLGEVSFFRAFRPSFPWSRRILLTLALLAAWCLIHGRYPIHPAASRRQLTQNAAQGISESVPNLFDVTRF